MQNSYLLIDSSQECWDRAVDQFTSSPNERLFPPHFLKASFRKIGGYILLIESNKVLIAHAYIFPRAAQGLRGFTVRVVHSEGAAPIEIQGVHEYLHSRLGHVPLYLYEVGHEKYSESHSAHSLDIGHPSRTEAAAVRELQRVIWGSEPRDLYPSDLHSTAFRPGTSLVARSEGKVVGFLFGFYRFGAPMGIEVLDATCRTDLTIESQLLGVAPSCRQRGIAVQLKHAQASLALNELINVVHWTVDPLQLENAVLNFNKLGAIALEHFTGYYVFRNALNRLPPSRFGLTWLLNSSRVASKIEECGSKLLPDLSSFDDMTILNHGPNPCRVQKSGAHVAIEIPHNWTRLQATDLDLSTRWRVTTDECFAKYLGADMTRYAVTKVAREGEHYYLVAKRLDRLRIDPR